MLDDIGFRFEVFVYYIQSIVYAPFRDSIVYVCMRYEHIGDPTLSINCIIVLSEGVRFYARCPL